MRAAAAIISLGALLLVAGCGEKRENLAVPETTTELGSVPDPEASFVQVEDAGARNLAAAAASQKVAPNFVVALSAWKVRCKDANPERVSCSVVAGLCRGGVLITPTKVPAGESAEDYLPKADASRVRCLNPKVN